MKIVSADVDILTQIDGEEVLRHLERCGRTCYKSEDKITEQSAKKFIAMVIERGHETILEHFAVSVRFIVDRGVSHELVRHRIASFSQESTRYCNYGNSDNGCTFVKPCFWRTEQHRYTTWLHAIQEAEKAYLHLLKVGATPQEARSVLPNSLKTEVVMTANLREWRHFFRLRALGTSGKPHPQMLEVAMPLLWKMQSLIPVVFDDLTVVFDNLV